MDINPSTLFMGQFPVLLGNVSLPSIVLLYLGPESIMPVGSFLAAALGIFLIFWRQTMALARNSFKRVFVRNSRDSEFGSKTQVHGPGQDRSPDRKE